MKRISLFLTTNLAVLLFLSLILSVLNIQPYLQRSGLNYVDLLTYALISGFVGAFISLLLSKRTAVHALKVTILDKPGNDVEGWLVRKVEELAHYHKIGIPDVGIFDSPEPNAFATGWNKHNALVAVSTGLMDLMSEDEIEAVLGHEVAHIANGDMVTMTLLQGVLNTFVIFFARIAAFFVSKFIKKDLDSDTVDSLTFYIVAFVFEMVFGLLASMVVMWFSRHREFSADEGSAQALGKEKMIRALQKLQVYEQIPYEQRAPAFNTMMISMRGAWLALFSSHPPLEKRIKALQQRI